MSLIVSIITFFILAILCALIGYTICSVHMQQEIDTLRTRDINHSIYNSNLRDRVSLLESEILKMNGDGK